MPNAFILDYENADTASLSRGRGTESKALQGEVSAGKLRQTFSVSAIQPLILEIISLLAMLTLLTMLT